MRCGTRQSRENVPTIVVRSKINRTKQCCNLSIDEQAASCENFTDTRENRVHIYAQDGSGRLANNRVRAIIQFSDNFCSFSNFPAGCRLEHSIATKRKENMSEKLAESIEDDNSVTMLDVLQVENQLEEDAYAVLGASDDQNCTYNKGYIRQALYACKTCCSNKIRAAVCLACSFHCHEGHELVELYTKRHFRCDCGNSKFDGKKCNLEKIKSAVNSENKYNQNFDGVYCVCARPYPDPDSEGDEDDMLQCTICEDWYHSKHLECDDDVPADNAYHEMICAGCMREHNFLWNYASKYAVSKKSDTPEKNEEIEVNKLSEGCQMPNLLSVNTKGSCFWIEGWRNALCTCEKCKLIYNAKNIVFLLDPKDSVQAYEEAGKLNKQESQYEKGMKALASMGHVQKLTAIEEYNNMKERLMQYLQKFADNKKVVREEDIKEFFSGMESKKRPKVTVPTYCR